MGTPGPHLFTDLWSRVLGLLPPLLGLGCQPLLPPLTLKEKSVGGTGGVFNYIQNEKKMKKLLFCLFTSKYSPALAQALQFPPDKAGPLSKPLGAGGEATATHSALTPRRFLSPQPGAAARLQGEAGDGEGKGAQKGLFPDVPKAAGGERRLQPPGLVGV